MDGPAVRLVAVVEDDDAIRKSFCEMVEMEPGLSLSGSAATLAEAERLVSAPPDVLLLDLMLPDGSTYDLISELKDKTDTRVIVISVLGDERAVVSAFRAGAAGYLLKGATGFEMRDAIFQTLSGHVPISPSVARFLIGQLQGPNNFNSSEEVALSPREKEVLSCLAMGNTDKEAARLLDVSPYTVADHLRSVFKKLEVKTRAAAVARAIRDGQLQDEGSGNV